MIKNYFLILFTSLMKKMAPNRVIVFSLFFHQFHSTNLAINKTMHLLNCFFFIINCACVVHSCFCGVGTVEIVIKQNIWHAVILLCNRTLKTKVLFDIKNKIKVKRHISLPILMIEL